MRQVNPSAIFMLGLFTLPLNTQPLVDCSIATLPFSAHFAVSELQAGRI